MENSTALVKSPEPDSQLMEQTQPEKKSLYEMYTTYIDPSHIILEHYLSNKLYQGQQAYIDRLNQWLDDDTQPNRPMVLKAAPGVGTKTILTSWYSQLLQKNQTNKQQTLVITHFGSLGSNCINYFYCLYRIITKLREALKIEQKIDLLEEKIRKYFAYWLEICNSQIEKQQVIYCKEKIYKNIVIIIQGVDLFRDAESLGEANIAFWMPEMFPKNIKILCTAASGSESLEYFEKKQCEIIPIQISNHIANSIIQDTLQTESILDERVEIQIKNIFKGMCKDLLKNNSSEVYKIIEVFRNFIIVPKNQVKSQQTILMIRKTVQQNVKTKQFSNKLSKIQNLSQIYSIILEMWEESLPCKKKLIQNLLYLSLSQKGLVIKQILELTKSSQKQWRQVSAIFHSVIVNHHENYSINCGVLFQCLVKKQRLITQPHNSQNSSSTTDVNINTKQIQLFLIKYHEKLAECLQNTPNSIRKLEEQTYHLFTAKSYFKLKEIVSNVQNFLLLFNSNNKYELSRYWQKLEEKGFDPVIEYNKAIEGFSMHYHPSDENMFRIIVQISRFLKQFCDFETYDTPKFRHPIIEGNMVELQKVGLLREFTELDLYVDNSFNNINGFFNDDSVVDASLQDQIKEIKQKYFPKDNSDFVSNDFNESSPNKISQIPKLNQTNNNPTIKSPKTKKNSSENQPTSQIEQINVDVPKSRDKFRQYYLRVLQQFMKNQDYSQGANQQGFFVVNYDEKNCMSSRNIAKQCSNQLEQYEIANRELSVAKIKQSYRLRPLKPSLYYYKRWIWIQFPWVCISLNNNYSNTPEFLLKNLEGRDIDTYQQQAKYTKQALMIAIQAKQKKKLMFTRKTQNGQLNTTMDRYGMSASKLGKNLAISNSNMGQTLGLGKNNFSKFNNLMNNDEKGSVRSRIVQKTFTNFDLSLNTLTKQLETRKKKLSLEYSPGNQTHIVSQKPDPSFFLSEVNQNQQQSACHQDMKFLNQRKRFNTPNMLNLASNEILPKLKWTIKDHTNYQINYIKANIEDKKKKLNRIIYQNKKLGEVYKQFRLKQNLTKKNIKTTLQNQSQEQKDSTIVAVQEKSENQETANQGEGIQQEEQIAKSPQKAPVLPTHIICNTSKNPQLIQLQKKKQSVIEDFCKAVLQKERLKIILKLCAQNKTKNQQSLSSLNYFLQSLKKMILHQKNNIKDLSKQISGIKQLKEKKTMMEQEKIKNQRLLKKQADNYLGQKKKLQGQIQNISVIIGDELRIQKDRLEMMFNGHIRSREQRDVIVMQERKNKLLEQRLQQVKSEWQSLKNLLNIKQDNIEDAQKFKQLLEQNQKNKKLKLIYFERKNKLQQIQREHENTKNKYHKEMSSTATASLTNKNKQISSNKDKQTNQILTNANNTVSINNFSNLSKQQIKLKIILNNLALKLGVKDVEDIVPCLQQKLEELKEVNPDKYNKLMMMGANNSEISV